MALSMLVTLNGTIMSGARVPYAVARDRYFFPQLAEVHPRFHTPSVAIVVQAVLTIILLLLGGNFRQLFSLAIFAEWLFYMIAGSTVFALRRREPDAIRPYKVWGYPLVPALFVLASAVLLYYTFTDNLRARMPGDSGGRTGFLLLCPAAAGIRPAVTAGCRHPGRFPDAGNFGYQWT
jgi:APA family basic amino acid/polyamine antiporter